MTGQVVHFEVPYDDGDRARAFYGEVFGWQIQPVPEFEYNFVQTGPSADTGMPAEPGYIGGGMFQRDAAVDKPIITIDVDDIEAALAAVAEHGGATVREPEKVGEMGIAAYFTDSEGNLMGLWQSVGGG
ncbi:VOC family protein [Dermatobacter hominis]|uniref:VOC family protein n=1 Tax=Dermatobacter hominis TaxID=2884263 RepID=UPI001D10AF77|nr:VOC family protein [Dermatobacter hominis]UDY37543.1 VOC family protein [Dermatobacter hominis]